MNSSRRYLLISPCRDEAQYLRRTLDSVAAQSVPPALWVVVDDGSTDDTPAILQEYARRLPYLRGTQLPRHGGLRTVRHTLVLAGMKSEVRSQRSEPLTSDL